jgi:hypothetical protein
MEIVCSSFKRAILIDDVDDDGWMDGWMDGYIKLLISFPFSF